MFTSRGSGGGIETPRDKRSSLNGSISRLSRNSVSSNENRTSTQSLEDKELFLVATNELDEGDPDKALWATAVAVKEGDEEKAKYEYIRLRVEELNKRGLWEEQNRQESEQKASREKFEKELIELGGSPGKKSAFEIKFAITFPFIYKSLYWLFVGIQLTFGFVALVFILSGIFVLVFR